MKDYQEMVDFILKNVGGFENIKSLSHCITRLRFDLYDGSKFNLKELNEHSNIIMAINSNEQYQVVIGSDVDKVYDLFNKNKLNNIDAINSKGNKRKNNLLTSLFNLMSSILVPIVPALAGAGMIKALLVILTTYSLLSTETSTYKILSAASNGAFYFLPILLAFSCSKVFKTNPFVSVAIIGALLEPNFTSLLNAQGDIVEFLGMPVVMMKYMSTLIPAILAIWAYSYLERLLNKIIHRSIESVFVPMFGILIMVPATAMIIGPIGVYLGEGIGSGIAILTELSGGLTGAIIGGGWTLLVMLGLHWGIVPVMINNIAINGYDTIKPAQAMATFAQAGVAFGIFLKAKDKKLKSFALSTMIPTLFAGVTEPAVYGLSVKYKRPLIAAIISGTIAGGFVGAMGTKAIAYAFASLTTLPAFMADTFKYFLIGIAISFTLSTILTYLLGFKEDESDIVQENSVNKTSFVTNKNIIIHSPLKGKFIPLGKVNDEVFSSEAVGKGFAIIPEEGKLYSPVNGVISKIFHTNHAIGILSDDGVEIIIHIGIDTVKLDGIYFKSLVKEGEYVSMGQELIDFDLSSLIENEFDITTPVIITNHNFFKDIKIKDGVNSHDKLEKLDEMIFIS